MPDAIADLLAPLAPPPADLELPPGTIEGPPGWWEGFGAGLRVWTGPLYGWRDLGDLVGMPADTNAPPRLGLMLHKGRLTGGMSWDLGRAKLPRRATEDRDDERG